MAQEKDNLFQNLSSLIQAGIDPVTREKEIWDSYGQTVATLVLDSSGFSRVSESHGIVHFLSRLMLMREVSKPIIESHNHKLLHFEADNVFAVFDDVNDAVRCALEIHGAIHKADLMLTDEERFKVCIGVGYGRMLYSETLEGYFAEEMNFASKLGEDTANGGETLLTENAFKNADKDVTRNFDAADISVSGVNLNYYVNQHGVD